MAVDYSRVLPHRLTVCAESAHPYQFLHERHLQVMWYEQKYFHPLLSPQGNAIQVISPGIWNSEAGPDFLKAHLVIDGQEVKGDIEIDMADENWYHHGHHQDANYSKVMLHLSLWKPERTRMLTTIKGRFVQQAYFEDRLTVPPARILQLVDLDLYPYKQFVGSGKCAHAIFNSMPNEDARYFFASAANHRLLKKAEYLEQHAGSVEKQLGAGLAMALGYKHNAEPFLDLYLQLSESPIDDAAHMHAILLGASGYFQEPYLSRWGASHAYQYLRNLWGGQIGQTLIQVNLRTDRVRPLNHPVRRLAYLAKLLTEIRLDVLWKNILHRWNTELHHAATLRKALLDAIPSGFDPYWNTHMLFEMQPRAEVMTLVGQDLKTAMLVNVILPLLYRTLKGNDLKAFEAFYQALPANKNSKSRYLTHRFFGETVKGEILQKARLEQGAFQLHRDFCTHYEASCAGCPFIENYQACQ
jgi:hypothetical protein